MPHAIKTQTFYSNCNNTMGHTGYISFEFHYFLWNKSLGPQGKGHPTVCNTNKAVNKLLLDPIWQQHAYCTRSHEVVQST